MKDRLLKLMTHFGYTATKFADEIGVQRSGISHIFSGRNQPSYDFIVKMLNKFPDLDAEWLILGKGTMLRSKTPETNTVLSTNNNNYSNSKQADLFTIPGNKGRSRLLNQPTPNEVTYVNNIQRIVILNSDGTFDLYNPAKKE